MSAESSRTVAAVVDTVAARLAEAGLHFGHGADNPHTEAIALLAGATGWPLDELMADGGRRIDAAAEARLESLVARRIEERSPAAYLTGRAWFAGLELHVDPRVLIPRSPLAEFIGEGFAPWMDSATVRDVLDLGTGSGCLAIATALALPDARIDAVDVSAEALEVARINVERHGVGARVRLVVSDLFSALEGRRYDVIVSNPPYVPSASVEALPPEYRHEPRLALESGAEGLDAVRAIIAEALQFLRPGGLLVVEVGEVQAAVEAAFPDLPFTWLEFEHGGSGVFLLTQEQLAGTGPAGRER